MVGWPRVGGGVGVERPWVEDRCTGMGTFVFMTIPGLVIALIFFAAIDRMGLWANRRLRLPWRRGEDGRAISAVSLDEMDALFYATKRYELDQRRSSLMLRDEENDGAPPHSEVDLETGTAIIRRPSHPR